MVDESLVWNGARSHHWLVSLHMQRPPLGCGGGALGSVAWWIGRWLLSDPSDLSTWRWSLVSEHVLVWMSVRAMLLNDQRRLLYTMLKWLERTCLRGRMPLVLPQSW